MSKIVGIVAEYNPFHNGHYYHITQAKKQSDSDLCIAVISGNFTQRGETSIINKWSKAYMAICGGANLVIELPTVYSISSAENFASGAVKILNSIGIIDSIAFGVETDDFAALNNIANILYEEPKSYKVIISHELEKGISYPAARQNAIMMYLNDIKRYANILNSPNNILAIEYLKSMKIQKSTIKPIMIQRKNVYYNDTRIINNFASASAIRKMLEDRKYEDIKKVIPKSTYQILAQELRNGHVVSNLQKYEKEIIYTLRKMTTSQIAMLPDVTEGLENAIKNAADNCNSIIELISLVKSKRYTQTRIQRILLYALLGINKKMMEDSKKTTPYARVLGFDQKGKELLSEIIRKNPKINLITSVKKFMNQNKKLEGKPSMEMLQTDIRATDIYTLGYDYDSKANLDYTNNMIITN